MCCVPAAAPHACCILTLVFPYAYSKLRLVLYMFPAVRTAAFGVRAAYLVRYRPALVGTWLAFNNAGFGANLATLCLALGTW